MNKSSKIIFLKDVFKFQGWQGIRVLLCLLLYCSNKNCLGPVVQS